MAHFDPRQRGNRRRVGQIRWKRWEMIHALVLLLVMMALGIWLGIWLAAHHFD